MNDPLSYKIIVVAFLPSVCSQTRQGAALSLPVMLWMGYSFFFPEWLIEVSDLIVGAVVFGRNS